MADSSTQPSHPRRSEPISKPAGLHLKKRLRLSHVWGPAQLPAPINPSTSASISNCSTASATARRKSPSPAFSSSSANANLSSVIGCSPALQVKVLQLHLSRSAPMTTSNSPAARHCGSAQNSTTSVDANQVDGPNEGEWQVGRATHDGNAADDPVLTGLGTQQPG